MADQRLSKQPSAEFSDDCLLDGCDFGLINFQMPMISSLQKKILAASVLRKHVGEGIKQLNDTKPVLSTVLISK